MPLTVYRRGEVWHYRGTVAGRRLRGSTKATDKKIAQRIAAEIEARQWRGHLDGPEAVLMFSQAAMMYRGARKPDRFLDRIEDHWKDTPVRLINAAAIQDSARVLYPKAGFATWNRQVIVPTQAIINFAAKRELCSHIKVERFQIDRREREPATWPWVQSFMANANPHLGALCCFMFCTAARISEALSVTWEDVDFGKRRVRIKQTKIREERWAHMQPELVAALAMIQNRARTVFKYSSRDTVGPQWDKVIRRGKLKPLSPHACRHGFATAMLHAGVDPKTIAKRGGWKSAQHVFATYGHAMEDETVTDRITGETGAKLTQDQPKRA